MSKLSAHSTLLCELCVLFAFFLDAEFAKSPKGRQECPSCNYYLILNMEVHHAHTSAPSNHRARKRWTHYFWEFLMLFLAVFCGFLAENKREHMIEDKRARKLVASLLHDLQQD